MIQWIFMGRSPGVQSSRFNSDKTALSSWENRGLSVAVLTIWHIQFKAMPIKNGSKY